MRNELTPLFLFHISMGTIALIAGAGALALRKGSRPHRTAGIAFVISMLSLSASGVYLAFQNLSRISVIVGVLTFYLVATACMSVYRKAGETGRFEVVALFLALATAAAGLTIGAELASSEAGHDQHQVPAGVYFFFGAVAALCAALDFRMICSGGVAGIHRIARHLWRMCFGFAIAANALFIGNPQVLPEFIRRIEFRAIPVLAILLVMIFWLIRVLATNRHQKTQLINER